MNDMIWQGITRAQLDAAYNNTAAVRNSADKLADWIERCKTVRAERSELFDLEYGRRPRTQSGHLVPDVFEILAISVLDFGPTRFCNLGIK